MKKWDYTQEILHLTYRMFGKNATWKDTSGVVSCHGNKKSILQNPNLNPEMIKTPFSEAVDSETAFLVGMEMHREEDLEKWEKTLRQIEHKLTHNLFNTLHSNTHIIVGARQDPNGEMMVVGGYIGLFNMLAEEFIMPYVLDVCKKEGTTPKLRDDIIEIFQNNLPEYNKDTILEKLNNLREQYGKFYKEKLDLSIPPIMENPLEKDFAITPVCFLQSVARGEAAKNKIIKSSEYGERIYSDVSLRVSFQDIPARVSDFNKSEIELLTKIARDKPVPRSRLPYPNTEIRQIRDKVACVRDEILKI